MVRSPESYFDRSDFPTGVYIASSEPDVEIVVADELDVPTVSRPLRWQFDGDSPLWASQPVAHHVPHARAWLAILGYLFMVAGLLSQ